MRWHRRNGARAGLPAPPPAGDDAGLGPVLRSTGGEVVVLEPERWRRDIDAVERGLLDGLADPVLDVGCGPGRIVAALAEQGRAALGVDVNAVALHEARRRGGSVLDRSVFAPLPGERRWSSAVLFDGNVGIGGDPDALLERVRTLLRRGGTALVELEAPAVRTERLTVRVEDGAASGPWFPWARVSAGDFAGLARRAGLVPFEPERYGPRWFARAVKP